MRVAVLGAGSWGTALAQVLVENGHDVSLWTRDDKQATMMQETRENAKYLPSIRLPEALKVTTDLAAVVKQADVILIVVPTKAIRLLMRQIIPYLQAQGQKPLLVHATKGLELNSHLRISQVIEAEVPRDLYAHLVVLSGPSHAEEVARHEMTTITAASHTLEAATVVQELFMNHYLRVYTNSDVMGVEIGAALKNIIALGAGVIQGLGFGDNAKAALITRGLAEMMRLGVHLGADPLTFIGLSGVGDLVVTCTSAHSRNFQAGQLLAQGYSVEEVKEKIQMVVEGISTCQSAYELAQAEQIEMPITEALYGICYEQKDVRTSLTNLMLRVGKQEASLTDACY